MQKKKKTRKKKKEGNDFFFHENDHEAEDRIMRSPAWTGDLKRYSHKMIGDNVSVF